MFSRVLKPIDYLKGGGLDPSSNYRLDKLVECRSPWCGFFIVFMLDRRTVLFSLFMNLSTIIAYI